MLGFVLPPLYTAPMTIDDDGSEAVAISDPLDEVLQQVSELTLRTNHIDAAVKGLETSITDLGETTHTGLVEIRGLLAQGGPAGASPPVSSAVSERLDALEVAAARSARHGGILMLLLIATLAIGVINLAMSALGTGLKKKGDDIAFAPPSGGAAAIPATPASPAITPIVAAPVPSLDPVKTPGKDPKAAHHHGHH